jgi:hypothetical protein
MQYKFDLGQAVYYAGGLYQVSDRYVCHNAVADSSERIEYNLENDGIHEHSHVREGALSLSGTIWSSKSSPRTLVQTLQDQIDLKNKEIALLQTMISRAKLSLGM